MVSKIKYPGICNNCGRKSEFYIRAGAHSMQLCCTCAISLSSELITHAAESREKMEREYNNSVETGLITPQTEKEITIWSQGYSSNEGTVHGPIRIAVVKAKNFDEAVLKHFGKDDTLLRKDGNDWRYWGCKLSDKREEVCWP